MNRAITSASLSVLICFSGMSWAGGDQKHDSSAAGQSSSTDVSSSLEAVQWVAPQRRNSLFKAITRRFQGTHFGDIAKESLENTGIK